MFFTAGGKLTPETGQVDAGSPARGAVELLVEGPRDAQHFSEIPKGVRLLDLTVEDGLAKASFDPAFFAPGGAAGTELRVAQVVFTLTQFPTIREVQLLQNGQPPPVMGEGLSVSRPLSRGTFSRLG